MFCFTWQSFAAQLLTQLLARPTKVIESDQLHNHTINMHLLHCRESDVDLVCGDIAPESMITPECPDLFLNEVIERIYLDSGDALNDGGSTIHHITVVWLSTSCPAAVMYRTVRSSTVQWSDLESKAVSPLRRRRYFVAKSILCLSM